MIPPIKYHGGKHYLANWLLGLMPKHLHYVEPYFGGGAVLLAKNPEGISEVANDIWGLLTNFWRVLQDPKLFKLFQRQIEATPFAEFEWSAAKFGTGPPPSAPDVQAAAAFFVRARQSRQGLFKDFATLSRNRVRRGMNEQVSAWLTAIEGLPEVHERLQRVVILNRDAIKVIESEDCPNTLTYCDPPYLHSTRTAVNAYTHEMTREQHQQLLRTINDCEGKVMLSGYPSPIYNRELRGWNRHDKPIDNKASGAATKRIVTESVWCNF
ncbi:MAG: DNA adenine methylase [Planctomycetes bacterium]|nr:DNA adenine methylase [Planctomycetota bacterium]